MSFITKRRLGSLVSASVLIATMAVAAAPAAALASTVDAVTPSTNDINRDKGWAHVDVAAADGSATLTFTNPRAFASCFEYRTDGDVKQIDTTKNGGNNWNPEVTDGLYPYECVNNGTKTVTVPATDFVEVRMVFGAEKDERFAWTLFDVPQPKCKPTDFKHPKEGTLLTAAQIGGTVTGQLDAVGCDIGVYNPTSVSGASISGALHYGIVADGGTLDVTNSTISNIGHTKSSMYGMQRGIGIYYTDASGTISGNDISDYQKGGIVARDGGRVTISGNTVTGWGPVASIAQNGVQVSYGTAAVVKGNTISGHDYTPTDWTATGLLIYQAGGVKASANNLFDNEVNQYNGGKGGGNIKP